MKYTPGDIATLIYLVGGWGPDTGVRAKEGPNGEIKQVVPKKGDVTREKAIAWLDVAIAVCYAESGGDPRIKNTSSTAAGLWQIMQSVHQDKIAASIKRWNVQTGKQLTIYDPRVNTDVAREVYANAGGWSPWEAYNNGTYKQFLGHGDEGYSALVSKAALDKQRKKFRDNMLDNEFTVDVIQNSPIGAVGSAMGIADTVTNKVLGFAKDAGVAIGVAIIGVILLLIGVVFFVMQSRTVKTVVNTAT